MVAWLPSVLHNGCMRVLTRGGQAAWTAAPARQVPQSARGACLGFVSRKDVLFRLSPLPPRATAAYPVTPHYTRASLPGQRPLLPWHQQLLLSGLHLLGNMYVLPCLVRQRESGKPDGGVHRLLLNAALVEAILRGMRCGLGGCGCAGRCALHCHLHHRCVCVHVGAS